MSKIVTIPTGGGNPFVVILGGVKYVYKPGETVEVPDGVALEIEEWERWHEKYHGENEPPFGAAFDITAEVGQTIVVKSVDENGKPTEWETVKLPQTKFVVYKSEATTEEVSEISLPLNFTKEEWLNLLNSDTMLFRAHLVAPAAESTEETKRGTVSFGVYDPHAMTWSKAVLRDSANVAPIPSISWSLSTDIEAIVHLAGEKRTYPEVGPNSGYVDDTRNGVTFVNIALANQSPSFSSRYDGYWGRIRNGLPYQIALRLTSTTPLGAGSYISMTAGRYDA